MSMILVKTPDFTNGIGLMARLRRRGEEACAFGFSDKEIEDALAESKQALARLDICGHIVYETLARYLAGIKSTTEWEDKDAGHQWLHGWIEQSGLNGSCGDVFSAIKVFSQVLFHSDNYENAIVMYRSVVAEQSGAKKHLTDMGDELAEAMQNETRLPEMLSDFAALFTEFATAENHCADVVNVCNSISQFVPATAAGVYISNAILAINLGAVPPEFAERLLNIETIKGRFHVEEVFGDASNIQDVLKNHLARRGNHGSTPSFHDGPEDESDLGDGPDLPTAFDEWFGNHE